MNRGVLCIFVCYVFGVSHSSTTATQRHKNSKIALHRFVWLNADIPSIQGTRQMKLAFRVFHSRQPSQIFHYSLTLYLNLTSQYSSYIRRRHEMNEWKRENRSILFWWRKCILVR